MNEKITRVAKAAQGLMCLIALSAVSSGSARGASQANIRDALENAERTYREQRANAAALDQLINDLRGMVGRADIPAEKYDAMSLLSLSIYFKGTQIPETQATQQQRKDIFEDGKGVAEQCIELGRTHLNDGRSECYYMKAINLGRWGLANGIPSSLGQRYNLRNAAFDAMYVRASEDEAVEAVARRDANGQPIVRRAKDGRPGIEFEDYGPYRVLGHMYNKLPSIYFGLKGDKAKAEQLLKDAVRYASPHSLNILYLAYVLIERGKRAEARTLLDDMLRNDPERFDPDRVPETIKEFREARTLRESLGS